MFAISDYPVLIITIWYWQGFRNLPATDSRQLKIRFEMPDEKTKKIGTSCLVFSRKVAFQLRRPFFILLSISANLSDDDRISLDVHGEN